MADYISTYYFFEQNFVNNFHNLSAGNILLVKYSFLKTLLIKNYYYFHLYQYNIPLFYHDNTDSFNYRSKGHKANGLYGKYAFTAVFE